MHEIRQRDCGGCRGERPCARWWRSGQSVLSCGRARGHVGMNSAPGSYRPLRTAHRSSPPIPLRPGPCVHTAPRGEPAFNTVFILQLLQGISGRVLFPGFMDTTFVGRVRVNFDFYIVTRGGTVPDKNKHDRLHI